MELKYHHNGNVAKIFAENISEDIWEILLRKISQIKKPETLLNIEDKINFQSVLNENFNLIFIPIPLNKNDKRINNHAELLTLSIVKKLQKNFPALKMHILSKILLKNSKQKQALIKNRLERLKNMENSFSINCCGKMSFFQNSEIKMMQSFMQKNYPKKNIFILIDDVTTTGATIDEAKKILIEKFKIDYESILGFTIAH